MFFLLHDFFSCRLATSERPSIRALLVLLYTSLGVLLTTAMAFLFSHHPTAFKGPALLLASASLVTKAAAVFIHTPGMKQFSRSLSTAESTYESSLQLLLLLHIYHSGGEIYLGACFSSTLVIGKVG